MDGLYYEFCRYSNNVAVRLYGDSDRKWAVVRYKRCVVKPGMADIPGGWQE